MQAGRRHPSSACPAAPASSPRTRRAVPAQHRHGAARVGHEGRGLAVRLPHVVIQRYRLIGVRCQLRAGGGGGCRRGSEGGTWEGGGRGRLGIMAPPLPCSRPVVRQPAQHGSHTCAWHGHLPPSSRAAADLQDFPRHQVLQALAHQHDGLGVAQRRQAHRGARQQEVAGQDGHLGGGGGGGGRGRGKRLEAAAGEGAWGAWTRGYAGGGRRLPARRASSPAAPEDVYTCLPMGHAAPHLVAEQRVQALLATPRARRVNHVIVQQRGHVDEFCDLGDALLPPPHAGRVLRRRRGVDSQELRAAGRGGGRCKVGWGAVAALGTVCR